MDDANKADDENVNVERLSKVDDELDDIKLSDTDIEKFIIKNIQK